MSERYHVTDKECPKHQKDEIWFVPGSEFTPNAKIQELIDKHNDVLTDKEWLIDDLKKLIEGE